MRIWDVPVECLCRNHLLAEHRELHAIWNIIISDKQGYSRHPEVMRWRGQLMALWERHEEQRVEMGTRGYSHGSPLCQRAIPRGHRGRGPVTLLDSLEDQRKILTGKGCSCNTLGPRKPSTEAIRRVRARGRDKSVTHMTKSKGASEAN